MANYPQMGMVRVTCPSLKFLILISLEWLKLDISNLVCRLIVVSTVVSVIDYGQIG